MDNLRGFKKHLISLAGCELEKAIAEIEETGGYTTRVFLVCGDDDELSLVVKGLPEDQAGKASAATFIRWMAQRAGAKAVVLIADCFTGSNPSCRPSENPVKEESIMVIVYHKGGSLMILQKYSRHGEGSLYSKDRIVTEEPLNGVFANLLSERR